MTGLAPYRPLTDDERTDTLLEYADGEVTLICGCSFWREDLPDGVDDRHYDGPIMVCWCERHVPLYYYDKAGVECA